MPSPPPEPSARSPEPVEGPPPEFVALLLADARLPTGAHTQSAGLEPALRHGMSRDEVRAYARARLETVTETEAATAVVARRWWLDRGPASLLTVDAAWRARTPSDAARDASDLLGRGYRRLAESVWTLDLPRSTGLCRPVVLGATAAAAGLDARSLARLVGYDDVQTIMAAALKLEPFDPATATGWTVALGGAVEAMVDRTATTEGPAAIPAHSAPQLELWLQWHTTEERRLYRA